MPYGITTTYGQSPQIESPLQHTGSLIPQHMASTTTATTIYAGSDSNNGNSPSAVTTSTALQTTSQAAAATSSIFRNDDKRLTREAMEKYLRNRNDMIIVILHAKVITHLSDLFLLACHINMILLRRYNSNVKIMCSPHSNKSN